MSIVPKNTPAFFIIFFSFSLFFCDYVWYSVHKSWYTTSENDKIRVFVYYEFIHQETRKLAAYIKDMNYDHFDEHTIDITKMCILDFMGVAIAGSAKKESSIWKEYYAEKVTAPQASLFQPGFQNMTAEQAAALNAAPIWPSSPCRLPLPLRRSFI